MVLLAWRAGQREPWVFQGQPSICGELFPDSELGDFFLHHWKSKVRKLLFQIQESLATSPEDLSVG